MAKLTLNVDPAVVARAKRVAASRGTSVSRMVESMLHLVASGREVSGEVPPVLARLRGSLAGPKGAVQADYLAYLEKKHR
jgi:hypothetical protein